MKRISFLFFLLSLSLFSCKKRNKAFWETDWKAPLIHDSLTLENLLPDSVLVVNSGNYEINVNRSVFEFKLSDFVELPDTTINHKFNMSVNLTVPPGTSFVNNNKEHVIEMPDGIQLKKIKVKKGGVELKVFNPIGTKTNFEIQLPGVTLNGQTLVKYFTASAGSVASPSVSSGFVDLSGYELDLTGQNGTSFNRIQSVLKVTSDAAGPTVSVYTTDTILFQFKMENISLDYARGYFGNKLVSDSISANIQVLNNFTTGLLDVDALNMNLTIENGLKMNGKFKLNALKNINYSGNSVSMSHPNIGVWNNINAATGSNGNITPSNLMWNFTPLNSNLEQYIENHGATNRIDFQIQLNPWGNVSGGWDEIYDEFPLRVKLQGVFPLNIGMSDLIFQDTFDLKLVNDSEKTHVKSGQLWINATNAFPFEGQIDLIMLDENNQVIDVVLGTSPIESGAMGVQQNGIYQKKSEVFFPVSATLASNIGKVKHCVVKLKLNSYNASGQNVKVSIPEKAFFKFKLGANLTLENKL